MWLFPDFASTFMSFPERSRSVKYASRIFLKFPKEKSGVRSYESYISMTGWTAVRTDLLEI